MNDYLGLILGVICAGLGGELFVRGTVGLAHWLRVSPGIIGATVAAFATSSPELSIAVNSALAGEPEISFGDALGSNILNIALILALALVISGIRSPRKTISRDFFVALLSPVVTGVLFLDGELSRWDGLLLLTLFSGWLLNGVFEARRQRSAADAVLGEHRHWRIIGSCLAGLLLLITAGKLIVAGARGIALSFGIDEFIIGATVVAVGTSVPELATTVIAKLRGHDEVSLGTILGSNIFNGVFVVAIAAIIQPIAVIHRLDAAIALLFGYLAVLAIRPSRAGWIGRLRGVLLLMLYGGYLMTLIRLPMS